MTALRWGSATDVGLVRAINQDQMLIASPLFAVADGMGGHAAGEVASLTAIESLKAAFEKDRTRAGLIAAAEEANRSVWERAQNDPELRGMGTTLVGLALVEEDGEEQLVVIHVGDSRVYLLRQGELEQLTTDHSLVQELVDDGQLSEAEADVHPHRHVLTRALGVDPEVAVDEIEVLPVKGDRYLLCSDGLPREVSESQMASILRRLADPREAAKELVAEARARGGNDNVTVVVVDVVDDDDQAKVASEALASDPGLVIAKDLEKGPDEAQDGRSGRFRRSRRTGRSQVPKTRPITFRVVGFVALLVILLGLAIGAIGWYARGNYFVGVAQSELIIYKGRPGGLLWFQPTVAERTQVSTTAVLPSRLGDLHSGKQEPTLTQARDYIRNLQTEAQAHQVGTAPSVPPSSAPSSTAPPSTPAPSTPVSSSPQ
ncbi:MAG TPA: Stp1/IreP family PP2C-type Ser/Thr phosphatase [Acidimicrobiales bacterium]|nr:Stp1/IreP family PP2C-type Ser/Thr phosphatase [Acidimicrobiales bacterium]